MPFVLVHGSCKFGLQSTTTTARLALLIHQHLRPVIFDSSSTYALASYRSDHRTVPADDSFIISSHAWCGICDELKLELITSSAS